jgi:hypothetical protein
MIVISGTPRSGTSMMMLCMRAGFGEDRILGKDHFKENVTLSQGIAESDEAYQARLYIHNKYPQNSSEAKAKIRDMNPNGFWECAFTVGGIHYNLHTAGLFDQIKGDTTDNQHIVKVVSNGLLGSNPEYVSKIIMMCRHPRAVAKSQERLKREMKFTLKDGRIVDLYEGANIHSPQFFLECTMAGARWLIKNKMQVHNVVFDELVSNPAEVLNGVFEFLGGGDVGAAIKEVKPKLSRSYPQEIKHDLWEESELLYDLLLKQDYKAICDYADDPTTKYARLNKMWVCTRVRSGVVEANCRACKSNQKFRESAVQRAQANKWDWWNEPCIFECGNDPDNKPLTISDSIKNNFWIRDEIAKSLGHNKLTPLVTRLKNIL